MTDATFLVRVVLDGDDDTDLAAENAVWKLQVLLTSMKLNGEIREGEVTRT